MFDFHKDKNTYFVYQYRTCKEYIIPFLQEAFELKPEFKVLEIGCAEAGVLKAFTESGNECVGIELSPGRVALASKFMAAEVAEKKVRFIVKDIYDINIEEDIGYTFDLIILKDVIEHIPNQELFLKRLKSFLSPGGKIFFGFPPWQMPFGGHQQVCRNKFLSALPYFHLFPQPVYRSILRFFKEPDATIKGLIEIKETGISIERFERIVKKENYKLVQKKFFLINPIYTFKFNLKVRKQFSVISAIPVLRNFLTTCVYYVISK